LINAGGDIRVHSSPQKQTWQISLKDKANIIGFIELSNDDSICSSGSWIKKLGKMHHLINPKLGISMDINRTVFCKAKSAMIADAWASIIFLSGDKYVDKELDITYHIIKN
jgi:thiamine biosynthesis lipoprotein ApbE